MSKQDKEYRIEEALGFLVGRAARSMGRHLNRMFAQTGVEITIEQWAILVHLWARDGRNQQELADSCFREKTSIARLIDTMEKHNLVVRVPDKNDRRNNLIHLTYKGKQLKKQLLPKVMEFQEVARQGISDTDLALCKDVLRRVWLNLEGEDEFVKCADQ